MAVARDQRNLALKRDIRSSLLQMLGAPDDQLFLIRFNASRARCLAAPWSTIGAG